MFNCHYEVSALYHNLFHKFSALLKMNRKVSFVTQTCAIAHLFTCSEQFKTSNNEFKIIKRYGKH